jgi:tetratricopeptide (TPR) repeat protein
MKTTLCQTAWLLTVAMLAVTASFRHCAGAEQPKGIAQKVEFRDDHRAPPKDWEPEHQGKLWTQKEKKRILEYLELIQEKAPGIAERATAYRKVVFLRAAKVEKSNPWKLLVADTLFNSIEITDEFINNMDEMPDSKRMNLDCARRLTHELVHLAEPMNRISRSKEWLSEVNPRLDKIQAKFLDKTARSVWECVTSSNKAGEYYPVLKSIAVEEGLPSPYAAFSPTEALAECASFMIYSERYAPPGKIKEIIKVKLLQSPNPSDLSCKLAHEGTDLLLSGKIDIAIAAFDKVLELEPGWVEIYLRRGMAWTLKQDFHKALADVTSAIDKDPKHDKAYFIRALLHKDMKDYVKALEDVEKAIRHDPSELRPLLLKGQLKYEKKDFEEAISSFDHVLAVNPNSSVAYTSRGRCWNAKKEYARALQDFNEAAAVGPDDAQARNQRAWLLATCPESKYRNGQRAVESARRACELTHWKNAVYLDTLAAAHAEAGDFSEACKWQRKALELATSTKEKDYRARLDLYLNNSAYREKG